MCLTLVVGRAYIKGIYKGYIGENEENSNGKSQENVMETSVPFVDDLGI